MRISCHSGSGLGGTQKAAWSYALGLANLGHEVAMVTDNGPMRHNFDASGTPNLRVVSVAREQDLEDFLYSGWSQVAHIHVPGYAIKNAIYDIVERRGHRPFKVVETNVFGRIKDARADQHTDVRLFISMASGSQAMQRSRVRDLRELPLPHSVVYYPVYPPVAIDNAERKSIRGSFGIGEDDLLVIRTGRPDARKWGSWETAAFARARAENPRLFFLQMEPPDELRRKIQGGQWGPGFICLDANHSQDWVGKLCQSGDIMLHAARFGESFGYSIAEGMAAGLPIVTLTTPWGDNAQVELVRHNETGFVCSTVEGLAQALLCLSYDEGLRRSLGAASRQRIKELANPEQEFQILSDICVEGTGAVSCQKRTEEFAKFARRFCMLQRDTFENSSHFSWLVNSRGKLESGLREMRGYLSDIKADIRTACGFPAYKDN